MPEGTGLAEYVASLEGLSRAALAVECEHASIDVAAVVRGVSDPHAALVRALIVVGCATPPAPDNGAVRGKNDVQCVGRQCGQHKGSNDLPDTDAVRGKNDTGAGADREGRAGKDGKQPQRRL